MQNIIGLMLDSPSNLRFIIYSQMTEGQDLRIYFPESYIGPRFCLLFPPNFSATLHSCLAIDVVLRAQGMEI